MTKINDEIDGTIKFVEVLKLLDREKFLLNIDVEKIQITRPNKNSKYKKLIELFDLKKDLFIKLTLKRNSNVYVYVNNYDDILVDLNDKDDWKEYIEFICNNIETINEVITKENRLNAAVKQVKEHGIESLTLQHFGNFYLTLQRIFSKEELDEISITINPNTTCYRIEKQYFNIINSEISNEVFRENEYLKIEEFTKNLLKSVLHTSINKKNNFIQINKIKLKNININDIKIPKNILLKGVPGTGKSRVLNRIINRYIPNEVEEIGIEQMLRINIHSASSNADLMQGIGVLMDKNTIVYKEKIGSILKHIISAIIHPNIPFFLVLEEIQENSLNELIGDLIFLIEDDKRVDINKINYLNEKIDIWSQIEYICKKNKNINYITLPNLVEDDELSNKKMIFPNNLYVLCTTNYRDNKKIIEDNLFRRFEVIDVFPDYNVIKSEVVKNFFKQVNNNIIKIIEDDDKDRYLLGHSNWIYINSKQEFYKVFLKFINEFKEIRQIEFENFRLIISKIEKNKLNAEGSDIEKQILSGINEIIEFITSKECKSYYEIIQEIYKNINYNDLENAWI